MYNENDYNSTDYKAADYNAADYNSTEPTWQPPTPEKPMNWYKFMIYFALFAGAILNAITGIRMLTGSVYEGAADYVYAFFPGLSGLDKIMGLAAIALAVLGIYTRQELAKFTAKAPQFVSYLYIGTAAYNLIYMIGFMMIVGDSVELNMTTFIVQIVVSAVMVWANKQYFANRSEMFVN